MADVTHADGVEDCPPRLRVADPERMIGWLSNLGLNEAGLTLRAQDRLQAVGYERMGDILTAQVEGVESTLERGFPGRPTVVAPVVKEVEELLVSLGFASEGVAA